MELVGWPVRTILRGQTVYQDGEPIGDPGGRFLSRPLTTSAGIEAAAS